MDEESDRLDKLVVASSDNKEALQKMVRAVLPRLRMYVRREMPSELIKWADEDDILQDVMVRLFDGKAKWKDARQFFDYAEEVIRKHITSLVKRKTRRKARHVPKVESRPPKVTKVPLSKAPLPPFRGTTSQEGENVPLTLMLDPGEASRETIQAVLESISDLHRAAGGAGLEFQADGLELFILEEAQ